MTRLRIALIVFYAVLMLAGAVNHVVSPAFYAALVPSFIPLVLANVLSTVVEGVIGAVMVLSLFRPRFRRLGLLAFTGLMVAFVPIHVWDLLKDAPAIGSHTAAVIRLVVQGGFIASALWAARAERTGARAVA